MPHPRTLTEVVEALDSNASLATELFSQISDALLFDGDSDRWSVAHHLLHLTQTSVAVDRGLRSSSLPPHATGRSRSYAEVRDAATAALAATPRETHLERGRRVVLPAGARRDDLVEAFGAASRQLRE